MVNQQEQVRDNQRQSKPRHSTKELVPATVVNSSPTASGDTVGPQTTDVAQ